MKVAVLSGLIMHFNRDHILFHYQKAQMPSVSEEIIQIFVGLQKESNSIKLINQSLTPSSVLGLLFKMVNLLIQGVNSTWFQGIR